VRSWILDAETPERHRLPKPVHGQEMSHWTGRWTRPGVAPQRLGISGGADRHRPAGDRRRIEARQQTEAVRRIRRRGILRLAPRQLLRHVGGIEKRCRRSQPTRSVSEKRLLPCRSMALRSHAATAGRHDSAIWKVGACETENDRVFVGI
jgi:hypothetical protein